VVNIIGDEFGGYYRLNDQQNSDAFEAARRNVQAIKDHVAKGGGPSQERTGELLFDVMRKMTDRAPAGHLASGFAYGMSAAILEKAQSMNGADFGRYLETIDHRSNPFAIWERTKLDDLFDRSKQYTKAYVEQATGGEFAMKPFGFMKGKNGPAAFAFGVLDGYIDEVGGGATQLLQASLNPVEAGRQLVDMVQQAHKLPEAAKQQYEEAKKLFNAAGTDDYHKGMFAVKSYLVFDDLKDLAQGARNVKHLRDEVAAGRINSVEGAMDALLNGPTKRRQDGGGSQAQGIAPSHPDQPQRVRTPDPVEDPGVRLQREIQKIRSESQGRAVMFDSAGRPTGVHGTARSSMFVELSGGGRDFIAEIRVIKGKDGNQYLGWGTNERPYPLETKDSSGRTLSYANDDGTLNRTAVAARIIDQLKHGAASQDALIPKQEWAKAREVNERKGTVANAVVWNNDIPYRVHATKGTGIGVDIQVGGQTFVAEMRYAKTAQGFHPGWGTNERWYPIADLETTLTKDGRIDIDRVKGRIQSDIDRGLAKTDALVSRNDWEQRYPQQARQQPAQSPSPETSDGRKQMTAEQQADLLSHHKGAGPLLAPYLNREIAQWANGKPSDAIEGLRNDNLKLFGDASKERGAGLVGQALADAVSNPTNRAAVESVIVDIRREAGTNKLSTQQVLDNFEQIATPGSRQRVEFDRLVNQRQIELDPSTKRPPTPDPPTIEKLRDPSSATQPAPRPEPPRQSPEAERQSRPPEQPPTDPASRINDRPASGTQPESPTTIADRLKQAEMSHQQLYENGPGGMSTPMPPGTPDGLPKRPSGSSAPDASPPAAGTPPRERPPSVESPPNNPSGGMGGGKTPGDRPVAGGNPDDPQNRPGGGAPTPRQQDSDLTRPLALSHAGKQWDIVGVNDGASPSLELVSQNAVPRFVPKDALLPRTPDGELRPREVSLVQTDAAGQVVSREAYRVVGVEDNGLRISRNGENGAKVERVVPYSAPNTEVRFDFPNGASYAARQTVNGSVRFEPVGAERTTVEIVPGMRFEARLQGRELEGPRQIEMNPRGELFARNPDKPLATPERISISDIAPTWQKVTSTTAPGTDLYMDSANYRRAGLRSGRDGESLDNIGTINGDSKIQHGFANQLYKPVLEALRNPATTGDVSIATYGIGTSREGRQYTDALLDYATRHPDNRITIHSADVQINGRRGESLDQWLSQNHPNIKITEPLPPSNFRVPHEKIIAIGDQVFIGSEKIGTSMSRKVGFMVELGPEDAKLMHGYIQQLGDPRAPASERTGVLNRLSERGVLIDDPIAGLYPNAAAMNRVVAEAKDHLRIYQSDLTDTTATQRIIDRARDGVQVDLRYRDIDPESKRMLDAAAQQYPNLHHGMVPNGPTHPIYQHENYVISERGGALSSAYMWEPKAGQVPRYTNGGEGGVLLDAGQARQYERYLDTAPQRTIGPGAVIDMAEEAWNKVAPRLFEQLERVLPQNRQTPELAPTAPQTPSPNPPATPTPDNRQSALPAPPQPGDANFVAYQQSTRAVDQLHANLNLPRSEASEKLVVAAATVAVQQSLRVDEVALNKPTATQPGGTTAFVIEKAGNAETDRVGMLSVPQMMQKPLEEGYRSLALAQPIQPEQALGQSQQRDLAQESQREGQGRLV
jgi:hypothetical protein